MIRVGDLVVIARCSRLPLPASDFTQGEHPRRLPLAASATVATRLPGHDDSYAQSYCPGDTHSIR